MKKKWLLAAACVVLALVVCVGVYAGDYYHADEAALAAMEGSDTVAVVEMDGMTVFTPEEPVAGLIFYPGGKVEHTAYAPLMLELARQDVLCVLVEMPLRLAVLDADAAHGIPDRFPQVQSWYIGGHSLGGSMAASCAADHPGEFDGLILLAAYSTADLSGSRLRVLSLYGSNDLVLNAEKYETYRANLPQDFCEIVIEDGTHAGFGSYGPQEGDGTGISSQRQIQLTVSLVMEFLRQP